MLRHCQYLVKTTLVIYLIFYKLIFFESLIIYNISRTYKQITVIMAQAFFSDIFFRKKTLMSLSPQREGGGQGGVVSWNFADNCGWLLEREVWGVLGGGEGEGYFLLFWSSTCTGSKSLLPTHVNVFQHFFDFCYTGNSRGQLNKKWNFQGCSQKTHVEFPRVLVFDVGIFKGVIQFCRISKGKILFPREFLRVKWQI